MIVTRRSHEVSTKTNSKHQQLQFKFQIVLTTHSGERVENEINKVQKL